MNIGILDDEIDFLSQITNKIPSEHTLLFAETRFDIIKIGNKLKSIDVLFLDLIFPDYNGKEILKHIKEHYPNIDVVMLTCVEDENELMECIKIGAIGYLLKDDKFYNIGDAIDVYLSGGAIISPKMSRYMIQHFAPHAAPVNKSGLTEVQIKILSLIAMGNNYKSAADDLNMTLDGFRYHIKQIYRKLGVQSATQALSKFYENKL